MRSWLASLAVAALSLWSAAAWLAPVPPAAAQAAACAGRYVVQGRHSERRVAPGMEIMLQDDEVALGLFCGWAAAEVRPGRRHTIVIAEWPSCGGGAYGALRLRAKIDRTCTRMRGVTRDVETGYRRRFRAVLTPE